MLNAKTNGLDDSSDIVGHIHADKDSGNKDNRYAHGTCPPKSLAHSPPLEITTFLTFEFRSTIVIIHVNIERMRAIFFSQNVY